MTSYRCLAAVACALGFSGNASAIGPVVPSSEVTGAGLAQIADPLALLGKTVSGEFKNRRLEDVLAYIGGLTGAAIEPLWQDDQSAAGLDKEVLVTLKFDRVSALALLELVLERVPGDSAEGVCTWQLGGGGVVQVGPKARLNAFQRTELYDVGDLLLETPDYLNAPVLDLQSALQGGGQSPFRETGAGAEGAGPGGVPAKSRDRRALELKALLVELVEPEQWVEAGGGGGVIRVYQGVLIVRAPGYVHRQIARQYSCPQ